METEKVELLPCPFCGGEAMFMGGGSWIMCKVCGAESCYFDTIEEAIEAWNRRVSNDN